MRPRSRHIVAAFAVQTGALAALVAAASGVAAAHVRYVTDGEKGDPIAFLSTALTDPVVLLAIGAGGVAVVGTMVGYLRIQPLRADVAAIRRALVDYADLLPWLLRLSIGLPMVGAGFAGYLFTPLVTAADTGVPVRLFGVTVGFALLFGLATRFVAGVALASYLALLPVHPSMLFAFEYVAGLLAIGIVGGGRPSADHVIARLAASDETVYSRLDPFYRRIAVPAGKALDPYRQFVPTVVRVGMGVVFAYLALAEKLLAPDQALAVVEQYGLSTLVPVPPELWVLGAALTELFLGVLLVIGLFTRAASSAAFLVFTTTLFGLADDPVLAHISLFGLVSVLLVTGAGPLSIDTAVFRSPNERGAPEMGPNAVRAAASEASGTTRSVEHSPERNRGDADR